MPEGTSEKPREPLKTEDENLGQPESLSELKNKIKDNLTQLVLWDAQLKAEGKNIKESLDQSKERLDKLKKDYPNDPDIYLFEQMYEDLIGDFEKGEETNLDTSFDSVINEMKDIIKSAGVRRKRPYRTILYDTVKKLRKLGIKPEYVVTQGNKEAPTVVLYMQIHSFADAGPEAKKTMRLSQAQIKREISRAIEANLTNILYTEGISEKEEIDKNHIIPIGINASVALEMKFGNKISTKGYENPYFLNAFESGLFNDNLEKMMDYRASAHNVLLASNISEDIAREKEPLSFVVIGAAHEGDIFTKSGKHPLPLSEILAYYGVNVIVVDAATKHCPRTTKRRAKNKLPL